MLSSWKTASSKVGVPRKDKEKLFTSFVVTLMAICNPTLLSPLIYHTFLLCKALDKKNLGHLQKREDPIKDPAI